jgi:hypothetical protein
MYKIDPQGQIIRIDGKVILKDVTNFDYQQYIHWLANGPHPLAQPPMEAPTKVPDKREPDLKWPPTSQ